MGEGAPPDILTRLDDLAGWIDDRAGLVLGVDFDGTLAPITDDPSESTPSPASLVALEELAETPSVGLALVSGRGADDLRERVGIEGVVYAGNHGLELRYGDREIVHPDAERDRPALRRVIDEIDERLGDVPGYEMEDKGVTATVHFRRTPDDLVPTVVATVDAVAGDVDGVRVTRGKQIRELRPRVDWHKGRTMQLLSDAVPDGWGSMYVGDDVTDEDAFRAVGPTGIGVRVDDGDDGDGATETDATYRIDGQPRVAKLLAWIAISFSWARLLDVRSDPWRTFLADRSDLWGTSRRAEAGQMPFD